MDTVTTNARRAMVLPLFKLGSLALRTLSKPIASRLKVTAGHHPKFRQHIINFAQLLSLYSLFIV